MIKSWNIKYKDCKKNRKGNRNIIRKKKFTLAMRGTAVLFSIIVLIGGTGAKKNTDRETQNTTTTIVSSSGEEKETISDTECTIEKGTRYALMIDENNGYIAEATEDSIVKVEHWSRKSQDMEKLSFSDEVGSFEINNADNGFNWIDNDHMAFMAKYPGQKNNSVKGETSYVFTIMTKEDNNKWTNYDEDIACYTYVNDDSHMYRAIPLSDSLVKIECWLRESTKKDFIMGWIGVLLI